MNISLTTMGTSPEAFALESLRNYPHKESIYHLGHMYTDLSFDEIDVVDQKIQEVYQITGADFYHNVCSEEMRQEFCEKFSLTEGLRSIKDAVLLSIALPIVCLIPGGGCGAIISAIIFACLKEGQKTQGSAITTFVTGCVLGCMLTTLCGVAYSISHAKADGIKLIEKSSEFSEWKKGLIKERYDLLTTFMEDCYGSDILADLIQPYPLLTEVPSVPVISPNGHIFNREDIENHLDQVWTEIDAYRAAGYSTEELLKTVCPYGAAPFKKEDLTYAFDFAESAVKEIERVKTELEKAQGGASEQTKQHHEHSRQYRNNRAQGTAEKKAGRTREQVSHNVNNMTGGLNNNLGLPFQERSTGEIPPENWV